MDLYQYKFELVRVIDGDTLVGNVDLGFDLKLNKQSVRLLDVDAPEIRGPYKELGFKVRDSLINFLLDKELIIRSFNYDSFGRLLGHVFYQDKDAFWKSLNDHILGYVGVQKYNMIKQGLIKYEKEV